jgi:hypothetical protein
MALLVVLLALACGSIAVAPAGAGTSPGDRAATRALLEADYRLSVALSQDSKAAKAADEQASATIAGEYPRVLTGAPGSPTTSLTPGRELAPRAQGESDRQEHQYGLLISELESAAHAGQLMVYASALKSFQEAVSSLRWSDPAVATAVKGELTLLSVAFQPPPSGGICADIRYWVASGYRSLSAQTRALEARQAAAIAEVIQTGFANPDRLVRRYEGPEERALANRTRVLRTAHVLEDDAASTRKLDEALGIPEQPGESASSSFQRSKPIGHGRTHTGARFTVEAAPGYGKGCREIVSVTRSYTVGEAGEDGEVESTVSSSSGQRCLAGGTPASKPHVGCEEGVVEIEATTLAQTRRVRLTLSDGRTITSSVTEIPKRDHGPAGLYFQDVRGPSPYPVKLEELGAQGETLRTVGLRAVKGCRRHSSTHYPVVREVTHGTTADGSSFSIHGYSQLSKGHRELVLEASVSSAVYSLLGGESNSPAVGPATAKSFPWRLTLSCGTHPSALLFGQLLPAGATALAATSGSPLAPLTDVPLPAALAAPGTLAYAALPGLPSEIVVRSASGAVLAQESLTALDSRDSEYCEGYAEPAV